MQKLHQNALRLLHGKQAGPLYDRVAIASGAFYLTWTGGAAALRP
jgi:hypothetical protein